tara:strand:+ start:4124 stop:4858 length:735 start_codon:yes stop_codon:yes gene_type:complete
MNLIFKFFRYLKYFKKYQYTDKYVTYKEALDNSNEYFDPDKNINFISPENIDKWERVGLLPTIIPILAKKKLMVLDYGGGNNPIFSYIKATSNISVETNIIETKKYCDIINKKIPKKYKKFVKYFSSIDQIKRKKIDIVCFNSSIQYIENYKEEITKLIKFNPKYILVTRSTFQNEKEDYFTLETIIKGKFHPYIFFSYSKFIKFLNEKKYKLIFSNKYNQNRYQHKSIKGVNFFHIDLLFIKK